MAQMINILFLLIVVYLIFFGLLAHPASSSTPKLLESPQQVHVSLNGRNHMKITWITSSSAPSTVYYGTSPGNCAFSANGSTETYAYLMYVSGSIHNVAIGPLQPSTLYYYRCGDRDSQEYTFKTPPEEFPLKFVVAGDLGQTEQTSHTLQQIERSEYDVLILPGDLSYANMKQGKWDRFGALVEPLASRRPWMVTHGNHEVEKIPLIHREPFTSYNARWAMPYRESGSPSNLFYSFEVAGAHVLMLGSYTDFSRGSEQYRWLESDLEKVDRRRTPWLIAVLHAPWYNTNEDHQLEYESVYMKEAMEDVLYGARVDVVFAGHVHAYERFIRVYKDKADECGPVYITAGAGGNKEGLAERFLNPQLKISAFREAKYGHGRFTILNGTHAVWTWHRNDQDISVASDKVFLTSLASVQPCLRA